MLYCSAFSKVSSPSNLVSKHSPTRQQQPFYRPIYGHYTNQLASASTVKELQILLEQSLTLICPCTQQLACMDSGDYARVLLNGVSYTTSVPHHLSTVSFLSHNYTETDLQLMSQYQKEHRKKTTAANENCITECFP